MTTLKTIHVVYRTFYSKQLLARLIPAWKLDDYYPVTPRDGKPFNLKPWASTLVRPQSIQYPPGMGPKLKPSNPYTWTFDANPTWID